MKLKMGIAIWDELIWIVFMCVLNVPMSSRATWVRPQLRQSF